MSDANAESKVARAFKAHRKVRLCFSLRTKILSADISLGLQKVLACFPKHLQVDSALHKPYIRW